VRRRSILNQHRQPLQHLLWFQREQVSKRNGRKFPLAQRKIVAHQQLKPGNKIKQISERVETAESTENAIQSTKVPLKTDLRVEPSNRNPYEGRKDCSSARMAAWSVSMFFLSKQEGDSASQEGPTPTCAQVQLGRVAG
jgi:hypothetical protein